MAVSFLSWMRASHSSALGSCINTQSLLTAFQQKGWCLQGLRTILALGVSMFQFLQYLTLQYGILPSQAVCGPGTTQKSVSIRHDFCVLSAAGFVWHETAPVPRRNNHLHAGSCKELSPFAIRSYGMLCCCKEVTALQEPTDCSMQTQMLH